MLGSKCDWLIFHGLSYFIFSFTLIKILVECYLEVHCFWSWLHGPTIIEDRGRETVPTLYWQLRNLEDSFKEKGLFLQQYATSAVFDLI